MSLTLMVPNADLRKFLDLVEKTPAPKGQYWLVFITISGCVGRFSCAGELAKFPVGTSAEGSVQIPLFCLSQVVEYGIKGWVELRCEDGAITYGNKSSQHDAISLLCGRDGFSLYPTPLQVILAGRLLDLESQKAVGLEARIPAAMRRMDEEICRASDSLARYGVTEQDLRDLVEQALKRAEPGIKGRYRWLIP